MLVSLLRHAGVGEFGIRWIRQLYSELTAILSMTTKIFWLIDWLILRVPLTALRCGRTPARCDWCLWRQRIKSIIILRIKNCNSGILSNSDRRRRRDATRLYRSVWRQNILNVFTFQIFRRRQSWVVANSAPSTRTRHRPTCKSSHSLWRKSESVTAATCNVISRLLWLEPLFA